MKLTCAPILFVLSTARLVKLERFALQRKGEMMKRSPFDVLETTAGATDIDTRRMKLAKDNSETTTSDPTESTDEQLDGVVVQDPIHIQAHSESPSYTPSSVPSFTESDGFSVCDFSVQIDANTADDNTVNYYYNLTLESNQNGFLPFVSAIETNLFEAVLVSLCEKRRQRNLATAAAISMRPADFSTGKDEKCCPEKSPA